MATTPVATAEKPPPPSESQVKAACLLNFPKYVEWPASAFAETNSPVVIAVSETKVAEEIQKLIAGQTVNGREIILKRVAAGETSDACHIRFVSAAELRAAPGLPAKYADGVLTVGESDNFLENGGIINLARRDRKIALDVNLSAAGRAGIKISSKLLNLARVVKDETK
jgi:hypothetical protein